MLLTILSRATPVLLGAALRVRSEVECPDPAQIASNVQQVLELSAESAESVQATVRRDDNWLLLSLEQSDGTTLGERRLAYEGDCDTLARAAAVVFAGWLSNEHPEFLVGLPAEPRAGQAPTAAAMVEPPLLPVRELSAEQSLAPPVSAPRSKRRVELGAGLGAAASASTFAPGVTLAAAWDPGQRGWGARLSVAWLGARSEPLAGHQVSWTRWPLMAGPFLRLGSASSSFDLEAGGALGWARLSGRGFGADATDSGLTVGAYGALRYVPSGAPLRTFLMAAPLFWFRNATAVSTDASGATVSGTLPSFEVLFALGAELPL